MRSACSRSGRRSTTLPSRRSQPPLKPEADRILHRGAKSPVHLEQGLARPIASLLVVGRAWLHPELTRVMAEAVACRHGTAARLGGLSEDGRGYARWPGKAPPPGHKRDTDFASRCCGYRFSAALKPYRGAGPMLTDLLGGQVQVAFDPMPSSIGYVKAGQLRPLAVTTATRSEALPELPSVGDAVAGYEASTWYGVGAPKNTPAEVIDKLNKEINAGLADPRLKARLTELGGMMLTGSSADFGTFISDETQKWSKVVKFSGAKAD